MSDSPRAYASEAIVVTYSSTRCIHAAECIRGLPAVFDVHKRPWIDPGKAHADAIVEIVLRCPSGALHFERKDGGVSEPIPGRNTVQIRANGPLYVRGDVRLATPEGQVVLEDTRLALCRCGQSQNKPFCDNSHVITGFSDDGRVAANAAELPAEGGELVITLRHNASLKLQGNFAIVSADGQSVNRGTETALCRCGSSANKPFCDGTHKRIGFQA